MDKSLHPEQNVVVMSKYQPTNDFCAIAQVEAYWEALRGTKLLPKRADIDPRGIEMALEYAFILERIGPGIARVRVAGSHLNDLMGMEVRGMPLTSFFAPNVRAEVSDALEVVFQAPAITTMNVTSAATLGGATLKGRLILLPLKSDLGDVSRVLGCFVAKGEIGQAPRRFDVTGKDVLHLAAGRPPLPMKPEPRAKKHPSLSPQASNMRTAGFSDAASPFAPKGSSARAPYLRLIKTDD